ncbi:MAG: RNA-binding transcriptional accessory protein, partial [Muribaculaceae bacterium]|nr:RNA-binding transcriptional accessory protein [Muribaculaceae bacterium]
MTKSIVTRVAEKLKLPVSGVENTLKLLDEGATIPFISRYRKEVTGSLNEVQIRDIELTARTVRELDSRKEYVINAIATLGLLSDTLSAKINSAGTLTEVEDLYLPFKPKKRTRATVAREQGLEPLAKRIMKGYLPAGTSAEKIAGAADIIAEWASESPRLRNMLRKSLRRSGRIICKPVKGKETELSKSPLAQYSDFNRDIKRIASHQYLAMRRGEREGLIKIKYDFGPGYENLERDMIDTFTPNSVTDKPRDIIESAVKDAIHRLIKPSVENEISSALKEEADKVAIDIFANNLRELLLSKPLRGKRILAIDPGYRTGCKVVALDEMGNLLDDDVIYPTPPKNDITRSQMTIGRLIKTYNLDTVAIGNGTASRETERFVKNSGLVGDANIYVVSEDGASVYSASDLARKEFPDKDVTVRGAVSIGRRLIDPLAELVKIDPKSIGVGQYQHDVNQLQLKDALDFTVSACVNAVGVDVNTASEKLLSYVSGIGNSLAANIVKYRGEHGKFATRADIRNVPRLGEKAFELSAGFLRITEGPEPLDNTGIHPESYDVVKEIALGLRVTVSELIANQKLLDSINIEKLAAKGSAGIETIKDIITELRKPGRDPRTDDASTEFVPTIESFEQLAVGEKIRGKVSNITAFGAFVDLGIKENGLIHISQISKRRIQSVTEVLKLGQQVEV